MIRHTVVFTLKHAAGSLQEKMFLRDARTELEAIPGVKKFEQLKQVSKKKNDYRFGFSMEFADQAAYDWPQCASQAREVRQGPLGARGQQVPRDRLRADLSQDAAALSYGDVGSTIHTTLTDPWNGMVSGTTMVRLTVPLNTPRSA